MKHGEILKELLILSDWSQQDFAKELGIASSTLSGYITSNREPDLDTLYRISRKLGVTTDYLINPNDEGSTVFAVTVEETNLLNHYRRLTKYQKELINMQLSLMAEQNKRGNE